MRRVPVPPLGRDSGTGRVCVGQEWPAERNRQPSLAPEYATTDGGCNLRRAHMACGLLPNVLSAAQPLSGVLTSSTRRWTTFMTDKRIFHRLSGQELMTLRREAGLTQAELAQRAGIGRQTVIAWEKKALIDPWGWAPRRMMEALGI